MYDLDAPLYRHYEYAKRENRLYAEWFRRRGLPYLHFLVLDSVLRRPEGVEPTELAEEHLIPKQTVTGILDALEREGHIRQERCQRDRRRTRVLIRPAGKAFALEVMQELNRCEEAAIADIAPEDMEKFNNIYATLVARLEAGLLGGAARTEGRDDLFG